ncbi:MAG TPA: TlpA family protein disulfide reductase [Bryobacteraceae bacterium]|nr:TlpA family protein disulfide reductase [Bryobacteraceae bacterium]
MSKHALQVCLAISLSAAFATAQDYKLGSHVGDFTVQDLKGHPASSAALRGDITVVVFVATQCPVSNAYNERMNALYKEYKPKGVHFIFINSNDSEPAGEVAEHARAQSFAFPVYKDAGNVVADRFGAQVTPESFVIDGIGTLRYHGSIDDSQKPENVRTQGLRIALDALISRATLEKPETKAFGCTIQRAKRTAAYALKPIDEAGFTRRLAAYKGKIVLFDFWASWCGGCREEMPGLIALDRKLRKRGFVLVTISVDEPDDEPAAIAFLKQNAAPYPAYRKKAKSDEAFMSMVDKKWTGALPATFLFGPDGKRAASFFGATGMAEIEAAVNKLRPISASR